MLKFLSLVGMLLVSGVLLATGNDGETAAAAAGSGGLFGPAMAMALAAGLCGLGQGKATMAACEGIARNPAAGGAIRTAMIIGLALIESLALYVLLVVFVKS